MLRRFAPIALMCAATTLGAQSISDIGARTAPQFHSYKIDAPTNLTISEFSIPLFVNIPFTPRFGIDVGTSFANARVEQTGGTTKTTSEISGLTDTQIRANLVLGNDFVILTGGVNLPTGQSLVAPDQQAAASLIGSDFLMFPISNMGTGLGGTGGIAIAQPVGSWNLGFGLSMRQSAEYEPFGAVAGTAALRYQPGAEYRGRIGLEHPVGTGRFLVGLTYSKFGDDDLGGSVYNTGDRYFAQVDFNNTVGPGKLSVTGWNLFRTKGTLVGGDTLEHENIMSGALAYGIPVGSYTVIEPNVEARSWSQVGASSSYMGTFGVRMQIGAGAFSILPSGGFSVGQVAAADAVSGTNTTASLTGFHATLAIRLR
jgi:hypothetical protein